MVSIETRPFEPSGDYFFNQSGLLKIYQGTKYSMDGFFGFRLVIQYMGEPGAKFKKPAIIFTAVNIMQFGSEEFSGKGEVWAALNLILADILS